MQNCIKSVSNILAIGLESLVVINIHIPYLKDNTSHSRELDGEMLDKSNSHSLILFEL